MFLLSLPVLHEPVLKYSIIIASYRRPQLLLDTLSNLMPQVGPEGEVIVVEQAPQIDLQPELSIYNNLQHIILNRPGTVAARNYAISIASGEILIFIDDDVVPPFGFVIAHLVEYDDISIGGVAGRVVESRDPAIGSFDPRSKHTTDGWRYTTFNHDNKCDIPHAPTCNLSFRRNLVLQIGGFDTNFKLAWREDSDLCFRIRALGFRLVYRPTAWLTHLSANIGGTRGSPAIGYLAQQSKIYYKQYLHYRDNIYFILKHFKGYNQIRWLLDSYVTYVGLSRWPSRLAFKNIAFFMALIIAVSFICRQKDIKNRSKKYLFNRQN